MGFNQNGSGVANSWYLREQNLLVVGSGQHFECYAVANAAGVECVDCRGEIGEVSPVAYCARCLVETEQHAAFHCVVGRIAVAGA